MDRTATPIEPPLGLFFSRTGAEAMRDVGLRPLRTDSFSSSGSGRSTPTGGSPRPKPEPLITPLSPVIEVPFAPSWRREDPGTPSSVVGEFGDVPRRDLPSAAELVEGVRVSMHQPNARESRSRSRTGGREKKEKERESRPRSHSRTPKASSSSEKSHSSHSSRRTPSAAGESRATNLARQVAQSPADADKELLLENRGLYQRIAALQRGERELLSENQDLKRQLASLKEHFESRRRQWKEEISQRDQEYDGLVQALEERLAEIAKHARAGREPAPLLSDAEIAAWFEENDTSWRAWAADYAHRDADRLSKGLHPLQIQELCEEVGSFVQLTDSGGLPGEVVTAGADGVQTLLHAMLANIICYETLASPFWVFGATSAGVLESPSIPTHRPPSAAGFRMDVGLFSEMAPTHTMGLTPGSSRYPPPLVTNLPPMMGSGMSAMGLPGRTEFERLFRMLSKALPEDAQMPPHQWRAQLMRLFVDAGMSTEHPGDAGRNEAKALFIESRRNYTRKIKDRFLGRSTRFLLQDQDMEGIERLERRLFDLIDDAMRFSCRLWSRPTPLRLYGLNEIRSSSDKQALFQKHVVASQDGKKRDPRLTPQLDPRNVYTPILVIQPAIVLKLGIGGAAQSAEGTPKIWLKGRVLMTAERPRPVVTEIRLAPGITKIE